jgi:SAM-dependent methyltransferase
MSEQGQTFYHTPSVASSKIFDAVRSFYSKLIAEKGPTPAGVDWPDSRRQTIRFRELCRLFPADGQKFSVLDYGCGYGALLPYLQSNGFSCEYYGFDICEAMIEAARRTHPGFEDRFQGVLDCSKAFDFVLSSGVFSGKLDAGVQAWEDEVWRTIDVMNQISKKGFAFNVLSAWREPHRKLDFVYYGDPAEFVRKMRRYSANIALLHDYDLWDFTILVRKNLPLPTNKGGHF